MNTNNDPILNLLLEGVTDTAAREAIITAHKTFKAAGPDSLPGAMAIYMARLIQVVVQYAEKATPSAAHQETLTALRKELEQLRQFHLPEITQAKEEMIAANRSTRRLRMAYVLLWLLFAAVAGAGAAGYGTYVYTALTPQQNSWMSIGKKMGRNLTSDEIDWLKLGFVMSQHNTDIVLSDPQQGTFGVKVIGKQPLFQPSYIKENGQYTGVEIHWKNEQEGQ